MGSRKELRMAAHLVYLKVANSVYLKAYKTAVNLVCLMELMMVQN